MEKYFIGIDLGTSSLKAIIVNREGKIVARARRSYPIYSPHPGWAEQDPEQWWGATCQAVEDLFKKERVDASKIEALGLSGQTHGLLLLDDNLKPLRKAITWLDQRSSSHVREIDKQKLEMIMQTSGIPLVPGFMAASILWSRDLEPEVWKNVRRIILPKDYIRLKITGEVAADLTDAGGTCLLSTRERCWSEEILRMLDVPTSLLPPLFESTEITGKVTTSASRQIPLPAGIPVCAGGADQVMGAIGNRIVGGGDTACIIGTGGQLVSYMRDPLVQVKKGLHTIPHAVPGSWIMMGAVLSAGVSLSWFINKILLGRSISGDEKASWGKLLNNLPSRPAVEKGLIFLPYLKGERTPHLDPEARGVFAGLSLDHSREDLIRAVMEGVSFAFRDSLERMKEAGLSPGRIIVSGGGAQNQLWRQILADVLCTPLYSVSSTEQSAYGAALCAAISTGFFSSFSEGCQKWIEVTGQTSPSAFSSTYEEGYRIYRRLYPQLREDLHALSAFTS